MDYLERLKKFQAKWSYQEKVWNMTLTIVYKVSFQRSPEEPNAFGTILFMLAFFPVTIGPFLATMLLLENVMNFWVSLIPAGLIQWQYQKLRDPK